MSDLKAAKRRISTALLDRPGVSGVGLRGEEVVVYLERDTPDTRAALTLAARDAAPGVAIRFEATGTFRAK